MSVAPLEESSPILRPVAPRSCAAAEEAALWEGRLLAPDPLGLDDVQAIALLCGWGEAAAAALIGAFGSLPELLGAAPGDLERVAGRGAAARVRLAHVLAERLLSGRCGRAAW